MSIEWEKGFDKEQRQLAKDPHKTKWKSNGHRVASVLKNPNAIEVFYLIYTGRARYFSDLKRAISFDDKLFAFTLKQLVGAKLVARKTSRYVDDVRQPYLLTGLGESIVKILNELQKITEKEFNDLGNQYDFANMQ